MSGRGGYELAIGAVVALLVTLLIAALAWHYISPEDPVPAAHRSVAGTDNGYLPGGSGCNPKRLDALPADKAMAERDRCATAEESSRVQKVQLREAVRANDLAEGNLRLSAQQARAASIQTLATILAFGAAALAAYFAGAAVFHAKRSADADNKALITAREAAQAARQDAEFAAERFHQQIAIANEANNLAKSAAYTEQRAWMEFVGVEIDSDLTWNDEGAHMTFIPTFKNIGRTPARGAWIDLAFYCDMMEDVREVRSKMMEAGRKHPVSLGSLVFPDRPLVQRTMISIQRSELAAADAKYGDAEGANVASTIVWLKLIGCVTYRSALGDEPHQTAFTLDVIPHMSRAGQAFPRDETFPRNQISFRQSPIWAFEAT
jgi:hypothetical protein